MARVIKENGKTFLVREIKSQVFLSPCVVENEAFRREPPKQQFTDIEIIKWGDVWRYYKQAQERKLYGGAMMRWVAGRAGVTLREVKFFLNLREDYFAKQG